MSRFDPRGRVNRALLVGVSTYDHTKPADGDGVAGDLPAVRHNLTRLKDVLLGGGMFDDEDIIVRSSPYQDTFSEDLRTVAQDAKGLLLCYFAGHGAVPSAGNELFLQMRNARVVAGAQAVFPGANAVTEVLTVLAGSGARRIVVILDCCYAGNAAKVWHDFADARQKIVLLMSVQANRLIDSGDGTEPTPFTAELVQLLGTDGELSLLELFDGLRRRMRRAHLRTTLKDSWEPQLSAAPDTDVLLVAPSKRLDPDPGGPEPDPGGPEPGPGDPEPGPDTGESFPAVPVPVPVPFPVRVHEPEPESDSEPESGLPSEPSPPESLLPEPDGQGKGVGNGQPTVPPPEGGGHPFGLRAVVDWFGRLRVLVRVALCAALVLALAGLGLTGYQLIGSGGGDSCVPPLELRVLTDPDLEQTVRAAADAYLTSDANITGHGCRRTGITVYSAHASSAVTALRRQTDAWQEPREEDADPQRDVGPQPDVWIPASGTDAARVTTDQTDRTFAELQPDPKPFVYSPIVLAVPQNLAGDGLNERVGLPLSRLITNMKKQDRNAGVLRADPEVTDSALLATIGLYGGGADPRSAEQSVRPTGPPSPTAAALLCTLPGDRTADNRTAAFVPEFLLKSGVGCAQRTRVPRIAEYPADVPALTPTFVRVRWDGGDRDAAARDDAVDRFHRWLTGKEGLAAFTGAGFRSAADSGHPLLDAGDAGAGVLREPSPLPGAAERATMDSALAGYRSANGPGRVLYLLDSSGSMLHQWPGASGGPGLLKQSLGGLGSADEYEVWGVYDAAGGRNHDTLLPYGPHRRADAEHAIDTKAQVRDAEADPHAALLAALDDMARRGTDDEQPQLIVYITDDEDDNRLTGKNLHEVLDRARQRKIPVDMVSLVGGSCDKGRPDALIAAASHGRCLDASDDLGTGLHDEVARVGTGED